MVLRTASAKQKKMFVKQKNVRINNLQINGKLKCYVTKELSVIIY